VSEVLVIFPSIHHALAAEELLQSLEYEFVLMPVPPHVAEGCGLGIKIREQISSEIITILCQKAIQVEKTHPLAKGEERK